ncbi:MAG: adenylate kinase [Thermoplasmata archaeon]|nr:adenylate kinase [Thermoplasmata archaeon]RLF45444.1 MAG: adenylate kinase [Thermoplasmata archaeon]HDD57467.1 adenylate kinase [Thermoplasmatales archaeon]
MGVIVVTGIPGVGKTTVMKKAAEGMDIKFVTFGTVMIEIAQELGIAKDRDEMRKLSLEQQKELQIKTAEAVAKMGDVIVDTHCTIKTPQGYMPGLPEWVIKKLNPKTIVVVEADPEEIFNRRAKDTTRNRDPDTVEQIAEHQQINRAIAMAYAALSGATVKIVFNHDNRLDEAVKQAEPVLIGKG